MKQNIYKRVEALERIHAEVVAARACIAATKSATEWLEELELRYGIQQHPGESRADALARTFGMTSLELKDELKLRASGIDVDTGPRRTGRR